MWNEDRYKEDEEVEDDFYREESRQSLVDDDEISPSEAGFMQGYEESLAE